MRILICCSLRFKECFLYFYHRPWKIPCWVNFVATLEKKWKMNYLPPYEANKTHNHLLHISTKILFNHQSTSHLTQTNQPLITPSYIHNVRSILYMSYPGSSKLADCLRDHVQTQNSTVRPGSKQGRVMPSDHQRSAVLAALSSSHRLYWRHSVSCSVFIYKWEFTSDCRVKC